MNYQNINIADLWRNSVFGKIILTLLLTQLPIVLVSTLLISCNNDQASRNASLVYPEADSEPAQLYKSKCGKCHAPSLPAKHNANMWVSVIDRMQFRMISKKIAPLNDNDKAAILLYLQTHAKK